MNSEYMRRMLEAKNLKVTPQRVVILNYLLMHTGHPTAEEIFQDVQEWLPVLSKATVYNTLNTLAECGLIHAISTEPGKVRYDANTEDHHHFIDTETGQVFDIPWYAVGELCESLGQDFKIQNYQITFYGQHQPKQA